MYPKLGPASQAVMIRALLSQSFIDEKVARQIEAICNCALENLTDNEQKHLRQLTFDSLNRRESFDEMYKALHLG